MTIKNLGLYRAVQIIRSLLYFALFALIIFWIRGVQTLEPWTVLVASVIAILEAVNLVQQLQPNPIARRARQLESLILHLRQSAGVVNYVEPAFQSTSRDERLLDQVFENLPHMVLTGVSGAGKTTALQRKGLELALAHLDALESGDTSLPFFVSLSRWRRGQSLKRFLKEQWPYDGDPSEAIGKARVWLLADGLDELPSDAPEKVQELRKWLDSGVGPYRAIFTCRSERYGKDLALSLPVVEIMAELSKAQIEQFARNYLGEAAPDFLAAYLPDPPLPPWAREATGGLSIGTPLILSALLMAYRDTPQPRVIRNPGAQLDLYLHEVWSRETGRNPATSFPFDEMISAGATFADAVSSEYLRLTFPSLYGIDKREAIRLLAHGLRTHRYQQQSPVKRTIHAIGAALTSIPITIGWFILVFPRRLIRHLFNRLRTRGSRPNWNYLLPTDLLVLAESYGVSIANTKHRGILQLWKSYQKSYYQMDLNIGFWMAKRQANRLLPILIDSRILRVERDQLQFSTPLLQDYFLAQHERLHGHADDPDKLFWHDSGWKRQNSADDHKIVILAGIVPESQRFITELAAHDPYVAALCVLSGVDAEHNMTETVVAKLLDLVLTLTEVGEYDWPLVDAYRPLQYFANPSMIGTLLNIAEKIEHHEVATEISNIIVSLGRNAVPALIRSLSIYKYSGIRVTINCLGRIADPRAIPALTEWAKANFSSDHFVWALAALAHLGETDAAQQMSNRYLIDHQTWRQSGGFRHSCDPWIAYCETAPDPSPVFQHLVSILVQHPGKTVLQNCFRRVLTRRDIFDVRFDPLLAETYHQQQNAEIKHLVAETMVTRSTRADVPTAVRAAASEVTIDCLFPDIHDRDLHITVISAMGDLKARRPQVIDSLIAYLDDTDPMVRFLALVALGKIKEPSSVLAICSLLSDSTVTRMNTRPLCEWAAETLLDINTPVAREKAKQYYRARTEQAIREGSRWEVYYSEAVSLMTEDEHLELNRFVDAHKKPEPL